VIHLDGKRKRRDAGTARETKRKREAERERRSQKGAFCRLRMTFFKSD